MSYNFLNYDGTAVPASNCIYDSNIGYASDFSLNGEVDGWVYYNGIHTYGCWNNYLFGTLYGEAAVIGRYEPFRPLPAESYYFVKIVMKLNLVDRVGDQVVPSSGRLMWRTLSDPVWGTSKEYDFNLYPDDGWHTYYINMGEAQWWQGDINDIRIFPIVSDGRDGDEFYIRTIEILSIDTYSCLNYSCDYYSMFEHNCPGIGERGYCKALDAEELVSGGTRFGFSENITYTIEEGVNDTLYININEYGFETVVLDAVENVTGQRLAIELSKEISKLDVGGYAECVVEYTQLGAIKIYSGTYANDSTVRLGDSQLARDLNFRDSFGADVSEKYVGRNPASGFRPFSTFKIKTQQLYGLLDGSVDSEFYFDPFIYSIEGGRRDWLDTGLGKPSKDIRGTGNDTLGLMNRSYSIIENSNKTIIDFCHPFNASGRITKIYAGVTLDNIEGRHGARGENDSNRIDNQLSGAKVMFFRPLKNGDLRVLPLEVDISDRDHDSGKLYSATQEYIELDCDLFVNKGDLLGIFNANIYRSKSISGVEIDALYYQVEGKAYGNLELRQPLGQGQSGLLLYARGNFKQSRLVLDIDLGKRVNVENVYVNGEVLDERLEYNVARCLDVNWEVDLFDEDHTTGYVISYRPLKKAYYNHPNLYYGKSCLSDGIKTVPDGLAADAFEVEYGKYYFSHSQAIHKKDGGRGMMLTGPKYFSVNGDCEWLDIYCLASNNSPFSVGDFSHDPISFTLNFPYGKDKLMHKSCIYFKEQFNFRSFAISHYRGEFYTEGTADDSRYDLIPYRSQLDMPTGINPTPWVKVSLDGVTYSPELQERWSMIDLYLAENPCVGDIVTRSTGILELSYDEEMAYFDELGGLNYYETGEITNNAQYIQATRMDWTILEHEWEPIRTKGYRLYCDYHESTKICEFEVFCVVENISSSMGGSIGVDYSDYGDYWWPAQGFITAEGARMFVGDTPRYIRVQISPVTEIKLEDILLDVSYQDVYMGEKGCQYTFLPSGVKRGSTSVSQQIDFKNVYGKPYNLYVDVAENELLEREAIFYSLLNNEASITNPVTGPDAYYKKQVDYRLANINKNVAINCPVYSLKNLLDGAVAWYSYDRGHSWKCWGEVVEGNNLNFSNLANVSITTINLPVLSRSKWWKIGFLDPRVTMSVREIQIWYNNQQIEGISFYHNKNQDAIIGANTDTAPHLNNGIVDGSYYVMTGNQYIGFELPTVQEIDKIVLFGDALLEWENSHDKAGIDKATALCIHGEGLQYQTNSIVDESYFEHPLQVVGSGIYCDVGHTDISYSFVQDFSYCVDTIENFEGPFIDLVMWGNIVNAEIIDDELNVTNSGIIGEVTTNSYFFGDFDVTVDLKVNNSQDNGGWGCYLEAFTDENYYVRVGRTYSTIAGEQGVSVFEKSSTGTVEVGYEPNDIDIGLQLRLKRDGINTTAYYYDGVDLISLATSTVLEAEAIKFRLVSDLSPLSQGITIGKFDNFMVDKFDADWAVNTSFSSTFTCTSGLSTCVSGGWGYYYNIGTADYSEAAGYKIPCINEYNVDPLDQNFEFTFKFQFQAESFLDYDGDSTNNYGVAVGLLGHKVYMPYIEYSWMDFFTGVQVVLRRDSIGIGLRNTYCAGTSSYTSLNTRSKPYYCTFSGDGAGTYILNVWDDGWDGFNLEATVTLTSSLTWEAGKIGVGSAYHNWGFNRTGRCRGWVAAFDFDCHKRVDHRFLGSSSINFSGFSEEYINVSYANSSLCNITREGFDFDTKRFTLDFHIMFNSLPANNGERAWILGSWHPEQALGGAVYSSTNSSWLLYIERISGAYHWFFKVNVGGQVVTKMDWVWTPDLYRWYHMMFCKGPYESLYSNWSFLRDGHQVDGYIGFTQEVKQSNQDLVIGLGFSGWLEEIRVSSDYTLGGGRLANSCSHYVSLCKNVPTRRYERYYTMSLYDSSDNVYYGKNMNVDVLFDNTRSYHEEFSNWCEGYYAFFAIDFGQRHYLDLVRSFPVDTSYQFTKNYNILYSNKDVAGPLEAFSLTEQEQQLDTGFEGQNYDYPNNFLDQGTTGSVSYIIDNSFYQSIIPTTNQEYAEAVFKPYFNGDFDIQIDFDLGVSPPIDNSWRVGFQLADINNSVSKIRIDRSFSSGQNNYAFWVCDGSSTWSRVSIVYKQDKLGTLRLVRTTNVFKSYYKEQGSSTWSYLGFYQMTNTFGYETKLSIYALSDSSEYPKIEVWWDNLVVNIGDPVYSTYMDARWAKIKILNGDGTDRTIYKAGFYPSVDVQTNVVDQYNCIWSPLGSAITSYAEGDNIALGVTVSGSSYVGEMVPDNITNGIVSSGDFSQCWGSENENSPWVTIHLNELKQIYRIKIHHGYDNSDIYGLINDYEVQVSTDNENFTTIFDISNNNSFSRTHDLISPVWARQIRIYINNYTAINRYVWVSHDEGFQFWKGAIIREVEIYEYYGFTTINSEDTPIIAIDLQQPYFIESHSLVGVYTEDDRFNWNNSDDNFTYSNSNLSDPSKVTFRSWGSSPGYDKWVVIKRNTATHYPTVPSLLHSQTDMPDYLKHVIIKGTTDQDDLEPNPLECPWMWRSTLSQLSYDYSMLAPNPYGGDGNALIRSLKIEYPVSSLSDHVYFIEGDVWGQDEACSWRDGFGFHIYIDDVDNLDLDYGYIYLGGFDYTDDRNPVVYRWNWNTISGSLSSGWNNLNLTFLYADDIVYTEPANKANSDTRRLWTIDWGKMGMVFRGKGKSITMNIDGSYIERNHFEHGCFQDYGLYLHSNDMMKAQISGLDIHSGSIEFFIRPDWDWNGKDIYGEFRYRALFHLGNVANDVFGAVVGPSGIEVYYGNLLDGLNIFTITGLSSLVLDTVTHMAFVFSSDGGGIDSDGSTIRVYVNNYLIAKETRTWKVSDNKHFNFVFGGQAVLLVKSGGFNPTGSSVDGVLSRLKIYNYCKLNYSDSLSNENISSDVLETPGEFVELSRDNVTFYKIGSEGLPLVFEDVPNNSIIPVWVRVCLPKQLKGLENRTAKIMGSWDIGV